MKMNRGLFSLIFIVVSSLGNIIFTVGSIAVLFGLTFSVMHFIFKLPPESSAYGYGMFLSFVAGLIGGLFAWTKFSTHIIRKYDFDEKFDNEWNTGKKKRQQKQAEKRKTVLPSSVLDED